MTDLKWATAGSLTSSLVTTELDSLADEGESSLFTYDNSSNLALNAQVTVLLGSITPSTGGILVLRVLSYDGTNTPDKAGGDKYPLEIESGTGSKVITFTDVRLYPFSLRLSIINLSGVALSSADNDVYIRAYSEAFV